MEFSKKLTTIMSLTSTKNLEFADALGLGRPYVSRLRTGDRKIPTNHGVVRKMAEYFSHKCGDDFLRRALSELTMDERLDDAANEETMADILFDWFIDADTLKENRKNPAIGFLNTLETFEHPSASEGISRGDRYPEKQKMAAYYGNNGKRQAVRDMIAYIDSLDRPCTVLVFTDEDMDWVTEDDSFAKWLSAAFSRLAHSGVTFERIQPPFGGLEVMFASIERWLGVFVAGAMQQYYYPWSRDKLHRRTLFVVPGHIAISSNSIYGAGKSPMTALTRDIDIVRLCFDEYESIKSLCVPSMSTFTPESDRLFSETEEIAAIEDVGIYKTNALSVNTLPSSVIRRISHCDSAFAHRVAQSFEIRARLREKVLVNRPITDIMYLPDIENVLAGKEIIPGTTAMDEGALYYTPEEYLAHLEQILRHIEEYPNYNVIIEDSLPHRNVIMFSKGNSRVMIVKPDKPFAVFSITEQTLASAFCDYLRRMAEDCSSHMTRRKAAEVIRAEIEKLSAKLG